MSLDNPYSIPRQSLDNQQQSLENPQWNRSDRAFLVTMEYLELQRIPLELIRII